MTAGDLSIEPFVRRLLGDPNRALSTKTELRYGRKGSLAVDLAKDTWFDHEAGEGGGVLDLVCRENGGSHREARQWLRDELGLVGKGKPSQTADGSNFAAPRKSEETPEQRRAAALAIGEKSVPALHTPAQDYLACRGIVIQPPSCLRYHPGINALVALVQAPDGTFSGIQRIYLKTDPQGTWRADRDKLSKGIIKGGAVRLTPPAPSIQLCESVEDGLALLQMTGRPTWAVPGAGFMADFEPPPEVREVILAPDHDKAGLEVIEKAAANRNRGAVFRQLLPPEGMDWCDMLGDYEERAAILEYDGEETRDTAEQRAWVEDFPYGG